MVIYIASQCQGFKLEHRFNDFQKNLKGFVKKLCIILNIDLLSVVSI